MSIKSFPDYKHLLQVNNMEYKHIFFLPLLVCVVKKHLELSYIKKIYIYIPHSFLVINVCNHGKTFCSPCILDILLFGSIVYNFFWGVIKSITFI